MKNNNKKDHIIPASVIGMFSLEEHASSRERKVWYLRKQGMKEPKYMKAENIGYIKGEYDSDLDLIEPRFVDKNWDKFEPDIPAMVSTFESQLPLRVDMWRKVLIPYAASTFVRNKIFRDYYNKQFSEINEDKYFINNSTQYTRYKFYNEYKSIMYLYSLDILIDEKSRFILPDSGVAYLRASEDVYRKYLEFPDSGIYFEDKDGSDICPPAYLLPLSSKIMVKLTPRPIFPLPSKDIIPVRYINCTYDSDIRSTDSNYSTDAVDWLNSIISRSSTEYIVSQNKEALNKFCSENINTKDFLIGEAFSFSALSKSITHQEHDSLIKLILNAYRNSSKECRLYIGDHPVHIIEKGNQKYADFMTFLKPEIDPKTMTYINLDEYLKREVKKFKSCHEFNNIVSWGVI